jgi:hypothetical protein
VHSIKTEVESYKRSLGIIDVQKLMETQENQCNIVRIYWSIQTHKVAWSIKAGLNEAGPIVLTKNSVDTRVKRFFDSIKLIGDRMISSKEQSNNKNNEQKRR